MTEANVLECALQDAHREIRDRDTRIQELLGENDYQKKLLDDLRIAVNKDEQAQTIRFLQIQIEGFKASLEGVLDSRDKRDQEIAELRSQNCDRRTSLLTRL